MIKCQIGVKLTRHGSARSKIDEDEAKLYEAKIRLNSTEFYGYSSNTFASDNNYQQSHPDLVSGQGLVFLEANTTKTNELVGYLRNSEETSYGIRATYGGNGNNDGLQFLEPH